MKHIFLHIGLPKTGTSTLQNFLFENAAELKAQGALYPKGLWDVKRRHPELAHCFLPANRKRYAHVWSEMHTIIQQADEEVIVLSSEAFSNLNAKALELLKKELSPYQVTLVAYLRRLDLWIESSYLQNIKSGAYTGTMTDFLPRVAPDIFYKKVLLWQNLFGKDNLEVRLLERELIPDICTDFVNLIGLLGKGFEAVPDSNVKPTLAQMVALYKLNTAFAKTQGYEGKEGNFQLDKAPIDFVKTVAAPMLDKSSHWVSAKKYKVLGFEAAQKLLDSAESWDRKLAKVLDKPFPLFNRTMTAYEAIPLETLTLKQEEQADLEEVLAARALIAHHT